MTTPDAPLPVKLVAAVLKTPDAPFDSARKAMAAQWGAIDFEGEDCPFDMTDYYEPEMGKGLARRWLAFAQLKLPAPETLAAMKHQAFSLEQSFAQDGRRTINIDVGYMDTNKVVLASFKYMAQKMFIGQGIWADPVCYYRKGRFEPFPWSFLDFKAKCYDKVLVAIREQYKRQLRKQNS